MAIHVLALILLLPSSSIVNTLPRLLAMDNEDSLKAFGLISERRKLLQAEEISAVTAETREPIQCPDVAVGASVVITNGTLLISFTADSAFGCCEACEINNECTTWRRNRADGLCELFRAQATSDQIDSDSFDAGGFLNIAARSIPSVTISATAASAIIAADGPQPLPPCRVSRGITYPNGAVVGTGTVNSAGDCCDLCRFSNNCRSWFHNRQSGRCIQNSNTPGAQNRDSSRFSGGTI